MNMLMKNIPKPTKEQLEWADSEIGVIIHLDLQVFEPAFGNFRRCWGYTPSPSVFNPSNLDTDQWIETAKAAGAKYAILVAKHCSGFSLWPTNAHYYSVKSSPWRNGQGDVVADFFKSCAKYGLKPGLYCSASCNAYLNVDNPGLVRSSNQEEQRRYNGIVETQLAELWSNYGKVFEIWFDGGVLPPEAGGPSIIPLLEKLQPQAVVLGGPEGWPALLRTIGNERAEAPRPCWSTIDHGTAEDGTFENPLLGGSPEGRLWNPGESDMPNRDQHKAFQGGWFWREGDDKFLYSLNHLTERYFSSLGRNTNMLIGMVIDNRGLVPDADVKRFAEFGERIAEIQSGRIGSVNGSGSEITLKLPDGANISIISLMEDITCGERVRKFSVKALVDGGWLEVWRGSNIGHKQLERFDKLKTSELRLQILESVGEPVIREFAAWEVESSLCGDALMDIARRAKLSIRRGSDGFVSIKCDNPELSIRYSLDGSEPDANSPLFINPFVLRDGGTVKAFAFVNGNSRSVTTTGIFGCDRSKWKVVSVSLESPCVNGGVAGCHHLLDDDPDTYWHTYHADKKLSSPPHEAILEMDRERLVEALTLMPRAVGGKGTAAPSEYKFYLSLDGKAWECVAKGKFNDIKDNPAMQVVRLDKPHKSRFIRFSGTHAVDDDNYLVVSGIGAIEAKNIS